MGLGVLILGIHGYFLWALGAAFGYDTVIYAQLGDALISRGGLEQFYDGPRYYGFQHIAAGVGLLWPILSHLAGGETRPDLAAGPHLRRATPPRVPPATRRPWA